MKAKKFLFLRDVFLFSLSSFGGPQAHLAMMLRVFVEQRNYLNENELMELNSLCQLLPGPASTQTIIGIAYKIGGFLFSLLTFFVWILPVTSVLIILGLLMSTMSFELENVSYLKYIYPMAIGFVGYAAYSLGRKAKEEKGTLIMATVAATISIMFNNAYVFPVLIILGALFSYLKNRNEVVQAEKTNFRLGWNRFFIFTGVLAVAALLGAIINRTSPFSLPIRLFENFYRNGLLIFGGGNVLIPVLFTEFVETKHYLTNNEFLTGLALQQAMPGPIFSFSAFIGTMAMKSYGIGGKIMGGAIAVLGINLPGVILMYFILPFWDKLKKISVIKKSLWGINAVAIGLVFGAFFIMLQINGLSYQTISMVALTFLLLNNTKIPAPLIVLLGLAFGFLF